MLKELDQVVLTTDLPEYHLKAGDIGVVVLVHGAHEGYAIEFVTLDGQTIAIVSVYPSQIRPFREREIAHARALESA